MIVEDNPLFRALFGSIEYQSENDVLMTDFSRIRAGSLHKAHGGFLMLHLRDLLADGLVWEKLRRLLRSGRLQIEEPGTAFTPIATVSLEPEAVDVDVKIVLIGSRELYYELQEEDPEFARSFRVKVDFAESFSASTETRRASSIFVARTCRKLGLPHFSAAAVARLLEDGHREADDQSRQSAIFARAEALVMESAALCSARAGKLVETEDVEAALAARKLRHDYPDQRLHEAFTDGDLLITVHGEKTGQLNGLTQIDLGDYRFGFPVRVTARTYAGEDGLLNIEREVEMSGPIHDKGVLILQSYLSALFARNAPLALNASVVFEQEYQRRRGRLGFLRRTVCAALVAIRLAAQTGYRGDRRGQSTWRGVAGRRHQREDRGLFQGLRKDRAGRQPGCADPEPQPPPPDAGAQGRGGCRAGAVSHLHRRACHRGHRAAHRRGGGHPE